MKAFLIACILLATVVFSPLSTCTARELAEKKGGYTYEPPFNCGSYNRYCVTPPPKKPCSPYIRVYPPTYYKPPFNCGSYNRYCVTPPPKKPCSPYIRNCGVP
uniref:Uncharacterized protein n=1 Tax=Salix viminalis TaxID=40686 RepID=A0A6N2M4L6_SALVM